MARKANLPSPSPFPEGEGLGGEDRQELHRVTPAVLIHSSLFRSQNTETKLYKEDKAKNFLMKKLSNLSSG